MATRLLTELSGLCVSSGLPEVAAWSTDWPSLRVRVAESGGAVVVESVLAAVGGVVKLWELNEAVERWMRVEGVALCRVSVEHSGDGSYWATDAVADVLFCEKRLELGSGESLAGWLSRHFLTTLGARRLPDDEAATERLWLVEADGVPGQALAHVTYRNEAGAVLTADVPLEAEWEAARLGLYALEFTVGEVKSLVEGAAEVLGVTVSVGDRHAAYYRSKEMGMAGLRFLNTFNVDESAWLAAVVTRKSEDGRGLASVCGKVTAIDRKPGAEWEVATGPLSQAEAEWVEELVTSGQVWLADGTEVVITDGTAQCHNENTEMNTAKFTYQITDRRGRIESEGKAAKVFTVPPHSYQFN